jgi:hypothetical protein
MLLYSRELILLGSILASYFGHKNPVTELENPDPIASIVLDSMNINAIIDTLYDLFTIFPM